jgi:hypothetical protein
MAVEYGESVMFTVEHGQTFARVSKTYASSLVRRCTVAQSRSVIDYADF